MWNSLGFEGSEEEGKRFNQKVSEERDSLFSPAVTSVLCARGLSDGGADFVVLLQNRCILYTQNMDRQGEHHSTLP